MGLFSERIAIGGDRYRMQRLTWLVERTKGRTTEQIAPSPKQQCSKTIRNRLKQPKLMAAIKGKGEGESGARNTRGE